MQQHPIAITMGDAAGIGPEIIAKAYRQQPELLRGCFVWGDVVAMRRASALLAANAMPFPLARINSPQEVLAVPPHCRKQPVSWDRFFAPSMHDRIEGTGRSLGAIVAIHRVVAPDDGGDAVERQLGEIVDG